MPASAINLESSLALGKKEREGAQINSWNF